MSKNGEPTKLFTMKVKESELEKFHQFAKSRGKPLSEIIKTLLRNQPLPEAVPKKNTPKRKYTEVDPKLIFQLSAIGNNLNQIARRLNSGEKVKVLPVLLSMEQELERLRNAHQVS